MTDDIFTPARREQMRVAGVALLLRGVSAETVEAVSDYAHVYAHVYARAYVDARAHAYAYAHAHARDHARADAAHARARAYTRARAHARALAYTHANAYPLDTHFDEWLAATCAALIEEAHQ